MAASRSMNPVQKVILRHGPNFQKIGFEVVGDGWPVQKSGARVAFPPRPCENHFLVHLGAR